MAMAASLSAITKISNKLGEEVLGVNLIFEEKNNYESKELIVAMEDRVKRFQLDDVLMEVQEGHAKPENKSYFENVDYAGFSLKDRHWTLHSRCNPQIVSTISKEFQCFRHRCSKQSLRILSSDKYVVAVFKNTVEVYEAMKDGMFSSIEIGSTSTGAVALAANGSYLAFPHLSRQDMIKIYYLPSKVYWCEVTSFPVQYLAFNHDASLLAAVSKDGTTIGIYAKESLPSKNYNHVKQFYRGSAAVTIRSLLFCLEAKYLVLSSDSTTVHVFQLSGETLDVVGQEEAGISSILNGAWDFLSYSAQCVRAAAFGTKRATLTVQELDVALATLMRVSTSQGPTIRLLAVSTGAVASVYSVDLQQATSQLKFRQDSHSLCPD